MLPNREGLFHAYPASIGIDEIGDHKLATCVINFSLFEEMIDGQWQSCEDESLDITGWFFLEKKDGSVNSATIDSLKAALGWDGRDMFWLQDTDLSQQPVQVRLAFEEYQGKNRIKVKFLNPYGAAPTGGVTKADEGKRRALSARLGAKFRALAGGTPAPAPKPAGKPTPPAKSPAPPAKKPVPESTMQAAWAAFSMSCKPDWSKEHIESEWFRILGEMFPGKKVEDLTPADWGVMLADGPSKIVPF